MYLERSQLNVLIALAQHGSVSAAASALYITQSAASQRLREAERRLGVRLTERSGRSVVLTAPGRHLAERAADAERVIAAAEADAHWIDRAVGPKVRFVLSVFDAAPWLAPVQRHLSKSGQRLDVVRALPGSERVALADGHADAYIAPGHTKPGGLDSVALRHDHLVCCCAVDDPWADLDSVSPARFAERDFVTYGDRPEAGFEYEQFFRPADTAVGSIIRIESVVAILDLVAAGCGVTILPEWAAEIHVGAGRVATVPLDRTTSVTWWLLTSHQRPGLATSSSIAELVTSALDADLRDRVVPGGRRRESDSRDRRAIP